MQPLAGELKSHVPHGTAKKLKNKTEVINFYKNPDFALSLSYKGRGSSGKFGLLSAMPSHITHEERLPLLDAYVLSLGPHSLPLPIAFPPLRINPTILRLISFLQLKIFCVSLWLAE